MSAFSSLSEFWQTMLPFIMLVEIVLEIGLFMYQLLRSNKPVRSLLSLAVMAVMIPLLFSVSQADPDNIGDRSEERRVGKECRCGWWADQ